MNRMARRLSVAVLAIGLGLPLSFTPAAASPTAPHRDSDVVAESAGQTIAGAGRTGQTPGAKAAALSAQGASQSASTGGLSVIPLSDGTLSATDLAETIIGGQGVIGNATFTGALGAAGTFLDGDSAIGVGSGVVLSSGAATSTVGPNMSDSISTDNGRGGDSSLDTLVPGSGTLDAAVLEFDVVPTTSILRFDFVFSSDEYNEYANTQFNDVFGFFVDGRNIALLPDGSTNVTVDTINGGNPLGTNAKNPDFYVNNDISDGGPFFDTEMDGRTIVLNAVTFVTQTSAHHVKLAIADVGDHIYDSNVFITTLGCVNENLSETLDQPTGRVSVKYDPKYLWPQADPDFRSKAAMMAQAVKDRAEATMTEDLALGFSVPAHTTIEARCDPAIFNIVPVGRDGLTDADGTVKIKDDFLRRTLTPYVKARLGGQSPAVAGTEWANLIDHELGHVYQINQEGSASLALRVALSGDIPNVEGTAVLGQDLLADTDDLGATAQSFLQLAQDWMNDPTAIDTSTNDGFTAYRVAAFYQYLAERFGNAGASTLEQRVADMARRLYSGPSHLDGVRQAIGAKTVGQVVDAIRDFYATAYVRLASNAATLPAWLRVLDETTAHGAAPGTGPTPPSWGSIFHVTTGAVSASSSVTLQGVRLERTRGTVYEIPLAAGLARARVSLTDETTLAPRGAFVSDALRLSIIPSASGQPSIDPAFFGVGPAPSRSVVYDVPVVGMDKLAIAIVAGRGARTYTLSITAENGTPGLTVDPIPDVSYTDQAGGILAFVHPTIDGVASHGLPVSAFSAQVDGVGATVSAAFDLGTTEMLIVRASTTLAVASHSLQVSYGSASATRTFQVVNSGGGLAPQTELSASGTMRAVLVVGGSNSAGTPIEVRFALTDLGAGLPRAIVTATVTNPNAVARSFSLPDEGGAFDSGYSDGAYGAALFGTDVAGTYTVSVTATGQDSGGSPFTISDTASVTLGPKVDTDGDGVADAVEAQFGLDPANAADGAGDPDLDGATTAAELAAGSNPLDPDTDGDGEADGSELSAGRSPTIQSDDVSVPAVAISATAIDGWKVEVTVGSRDGATPVHLYRSSDGGLVDLGLRSGAGEKLVDGPLTAASYQYIVVGEMSGGARSAPVSTDPITVADDVTPPTARIVVNGDRPATNDTTVTVQFTDLTEPVSSMRLSETLAGLANAPWVTYQTPTTFVVGSSVGLHSLFAEVRDTAGNVSSPAQAIVELDTSPPSSAAGALPAATAAPLAVPYTGSDSGSGIETVELWARHRATPSDAWGPWAFVASATSSPISYGFAGEGQYEFYTLAVDLAGNREAPPSVADAATTFDLTPPVTSAGPLDAQYSTASVQVPFVGSDNLAGIASVELWSRYRRTTSDPWGTWTLGPTGSGSPLSFTFGSGAGFYEFYSIGIDAARNREAAPLVADAATQKTAPTGTTKAWGSNSQGQLGNGTTNGSTTPSDVASLTGITALGTGAEHSLAVKSDGTGWAWGQNANGELGDGTTTDRLTPVQVSGITGATAVAGGTAHSLVLKSNGTVWSFGLNQNGQLGDGTTTQRTSPVQVSGLTGVIAIAAGSDHSIALKPDGTVWAWGKNTNGQLGDGTKQKRTTPVRVGTLTGVVAIAAGGDHSLAVKSDGTVWAWGYNFYGELGDGTTTNRTSPVRSGTLTGVSGIAAGSNHSLAVKSDGTVWAWGNNGVGQLGDGTTTNRTTAVRSGTLTGVTKLAAGAHHSLAVKSDGTLWAWGYNLYGQVGDGTTTNRTSAVQVTGLSNIAVVAGGAFFSLAATGG